LQVLTKSNSRPGACRFAQVTFKKACLLLLSLGHIYQDSQYSMAISNNFADCYLH